MKKHRKIFALIFCIIILSVIVIPASAGVEPSPFRAELKKLDNIENKLESYHSRLSRTISNLPGEGETAKGGDIGKFWHMARDINRLNSQLKTILEDIIIQQDPLPSEVESALIDIRLDANALVDLVNPLLTTQLDYDLIIAIEQVYNSAYATVSLVDSYLR